MKLKYFETEIDVFGLPQIHRASVDPIKVNVKIELIFSFDLNINRCDAIFECPLSIHSLQFYGTYHAIRSNITDIRLPECLSTAFTIRGKLCGFSTWILRFVQNLTLNSSNSKYKNFEFRINFNFLHFVLI